MYLPSHFEETRVEVLHQLIREHSLAVLVTLGSEGLNANHIPFEIEPTPAPFGTLRGHVARDNPVWRDFSKDVQALLVFQRLTNRHEAARPQPWKITDAPGDYIEKMLGAIVGIEVPVARLLGKWKASQNRPPADRDGVVRGLGEIDDADAATMARLVKESANS